MYHFDGPPSPRIHTFVDRLQIGLARGTGIKGDGGQTALQRDHVQQYEEERETEPGPEVLLPGGGPACALHQRSRLSDCLVRVRKDNCQGNPSNYDRLILCCARPATTGDVV